MIMMKKVHHFEIGSHQSCLILLSRPNSEMFDDSFSTKISVECVYKLYMLFFNRYLCKRCRIKTSVKEIMARIYEKYLVHTDHLNRVIIIMITCQVKYVKDISRTSFSYL